MTAENGEGVVMAGLENPLDFVVNGGSPYTVGRAIRAGGTVTDFNLLSGRRC